MSETRFTGRAQAALRLAQEYSAKLGRGYVDSERLLLGLAREGKEVAAKMPQSAGLEPENLKIAIARMVEMSTPGGTPSRGLTPWCRKITELPLTEAARLGHHYVGTEHLLLDILHEGDRVTMWMLSGTGVEPRRLHIDMVAAIGGGASPSPSQGDGKTREREYSGDTKLLDQFSRDLTRLAAGGMLDPVVGRDREINRVIQTLSCRQKNSPTLIDEPGMGKTTMAERPARRMVAEDVSNKLHSKRLLSLNLSSMMTGTKYRGEFEEQVENILTEVRRVGDIILFIDELHTIVGAGPTEGAINAANVIKPALDRGELQVIGATTTDEHRKYIRKDAVLERRFQPVLVPEPGQDTAWVILRGLRGRYETHRHLQITDEFIDTAVTLSARYIGDRRLPNEAIDLIDEVCSWIWMERLTTPPDLRELEEEMEHTRHEKKEAIRGQDFEKAAMLRDAEEDFHKEPEQQRTTQRSGQNTDAVTAEDVAVVVSGWTGVPVTTPAEAEGARLPDLEGALHRQVVDQEETIRAVARVARRGRVGLRGPGRSTGCFLFLGPTGISKTEPYKTLAAALFGNEGALLHFDMSEYMEKYTVFRLISSPSDYVGHEEGGQLTEEVRRRPYYMVLFDKVEKAHPDIWGILLQIVEDGIVTDARGRKAGFKNAIVVFTSNMGATCIAARGNKLGLSATERQDGETHLIEELKTAVLDDLKKVFRPEFLNHLDEAIVFTQLGRTGAQAVAQYMLERMEEHMKALGVTLHFTDRTLETLTDQSFDPDYGAWPPRRTIRTQAEDMAIEQLLSGALQTGDTVSVDGAEDGLRLYAQPAEIQALDTKESEL